MANNLKDLLALAERQDEQYGVPNMPAQNPLQNLLQMASSVAQQTANPNTERGQIFRGAGNAYLGGLNTQNRQRFFAEVGQISKAPIDPAQKINMLMGLKAQHGTDYGLGVDDIVKQFADLRGQDITMRGQDMTAGGRGWQPQTKEDAIDFENAKAGMKPPTEAQSTIANYASRLEQANREFDRMAGYINNLPVVGTAINQAAPNFMKSSEWQSYEQAQRNFLNAVLRKESGAVISPTEFAEGRKQYFPMPGDKPAVIKQKNDNRRLVQENFIRAAGRAYETFREADGGGAPMYASNKKTGQRIVSLDGGQTWQPA